VENRLRVGVVGGSPWPVGGPWRVDRLERIDIEWGIGWWRKGDQRLPEAVETEEEFDGCGPGEGLPSAEIGVRKDEPSATRFGVGSLGGLGSGGVAPWGA